MVVIDDGGNDWRHVVLPLALESEPVMYAVLAVSVSHFSANVSNDVFGKGGNFYLKVISSLREQQNLDQMSPSSLSNVLVSVLLLLVGVLVSGSTDFPRIFCMMEAILVSIGDTSHLGDGDLAVFLQRQIPK